MTEGQDYDERERSGVLTALGDVLESGVIGARSRLRHLLRYLVIEELEGRGADIKPVDIGVDIFGRGPDFDPNEDSIVRVEVNRLRQALTRFYAEEGSSAEVRISIPSRTYRPQFEFLPSTDESRSAGPTEGAAIAGRASRLALRPRFRAAIVGVVAVGAVALAAGLYLGGVLPAPDHRPEERLERLTIAVPPIPAPDELSGVAAVVREQLIANLTHLGTVKVQGPENEAPSTGPYRIDAAILAQSADAAPLLQVRLSARDDAVLWSRTQELPFRESGYEEWLGEATGKISIELGGEQGVVTSDAFRRLEARLGGSGSDDLTEQECLLLSFAFDNMKEREFRARTRRCLNRAVAAGSRNGAIWARHALMVFLDWSHGRTDDDQLESALRAARYAVQLDPFNATARQHLGAILSATNDSASAIEEFKRGLELAPFKPSLNFDLGWQLALQGDWRGGLALIRRAIRISPYAPGYMRIPLALDAFRRGDYTESLRYATAVAQLGDTRGVVLAMGAAAAAGDLTAARRYVAQLKERDAFNPLDPFHAVRSSFSNPPILAEYDRVFRSRGVI